MTRRLREDRGGILVISAVFIPVALLFGALVVDVGNWYTHKRSLQNRADAGALAAGVEYISQLSNCRTAPGATGTVIANVAKRYAGTNDGTIAGDKYNQTINVQPNLSVVINGATPTSADFSDGGNPCVDHPTGDWISPGGIWTDVKARETNIGTLFRSFGKNLSSVTAQARVEVKQILGISKRGLPLVNETGDYVDCVWARFVNVRTGGTSGILPAGVPNPVPLVLDANTPRRWTYSVPAPGIDITSSRDDIAVEYWMGVRTGGTCDFSTQQKGQVPTLLDESTAPINWINIYDDDSPGANEAPKLHHFTLTPGTCGPSRAGFVYSLLPCTVTVAAEVDSGPNPLPSEVTVDIEDSEAPISPTLSGVTLPGPGPMYTGPITLNPNELSGSTTITGDYTQVGRHRLRVRWRQTAGRVGAQNCTSASPCTGTFLSEQPGNWQHAVYLADPLRSNPLFAAELLVGSTPMQNSWAAGGPDTGPFTIEVKNLGVDQDHVALVRESVQSSGNRTFTVDCGQGNGSSGGGPPATGLEGAVVFGCPVRTVVNQRADSCNPAPPLPSGAWDCVSTRPGNSTGPTQDGYERRFLCSMPNRWIDGVSPGNLSDDDGRYAYIFLTTIGRIANVNPNTWLPIRAFLRVYVTGWDTQRGAESCGGANDPPPRGYSRSGNAGAQLWGHFVDIITLTDDVIVGDPECDLNLDLITCKPVLVR